MNEATVKAFEGRIAALEQKTDGHEKWMGEIAGDVKTILGEINKMSGGKKALLGLFGIIGTICAILAALVTVARWLYDMLRH